jgi:hypothetical protein
MLTGDELAFEHTTTIMDLQEFLTLAELQQYYDNFRNDLKVINVGQIKYVEDSDLVSFGMTKPEIRRLRQIYKKSHPHGALGKLKKVCVIFILMFLLRIFSLFMCVFLAKNLDNKRGQQSLFNMAYSRPFILSGRYNVDFVACKKLLFCCVNETSGQQTHLLYRAMKRSIISCPVSLLFYDTKDTGLFFYSGYRVPLCDTGI